MNLPGWIPHPASWASSIALYVFALAVNLAMAFVIPLLFDLMPDAPRLAWLGVLLVWLAPVAVAAVGHRVVHGMLDLVDPEAVGESAAHGLTSLWAGFVAWATIVLVTIATTLTMLVLDPPPVDPDAVLGLFNLTTHGLRGTARAVIWIVLAAYAYDLQRVARTSARA